MRILGELSLLAAFILSGYAGFACLIARRDEHRRLLRSGLLAAAASLVALTITLGVLAAALWAKDFSFDYVARYSSRLLPWNYSLSALWVGQAGSLLLWTWITSTLALIFRVQAGRDARPVHQVAFGILNVYVCFLTTIMVFAADPMQASVDVGRDGAGLSPLLQHPAMMIHPPVVFTGYALWTIPFALAVAALLTGELDKYWVERARPWALVAWVILGGGILLGAFWAYEELGWGGYWGWDPVENGSLIPWLTGTSLIHCLMVWRHLGGLKKTAIALAIATFGLCNFATFLTRSGIFSSLHAFSQSPIGWMFLVLMLVMLAGGAALLYGRRGRLRPERRLSGLWARETMVVVSTALLLLLTSVVLIGTISLPLSTYLFGRQAVVGPEFYNAVLVPIGLLLLACTAVVPLLRWGGNPSREQGAFLLGSCVVGVAATLIAALGTGIRNPIAMLVTLTAAVAVAAIFSALWLDSMRRTEDSFGLAMLRVLTRQRRQYAGYLVHLGFVCVAIGITGTALGTRRNDFALQEGQTVTWAGREIRFERLIQRRLADKVVLEAELHISQAGRRPYTLLPARHFHRLQEQWTTEVAVHGTWSGDFYSILNGGEDGRVFVTLIENPMMRWLWLGGFVSGCAALIAIWPDRRKAAAQDQRRRGDANGTGGMRPLKSAA